mmetsp:Transcript_15823/g.37499  ORF Transcript_15823/g.37499 Transcript_15823/m.37499 type:complete len:239 (+) Transcript_15823:237-953(+)
MSAPQWKALSLSGRTSSSQSTFSPSSMYWRGVCLFLEALMNAIPTAHTMLRASTLKKSTGSLPRTPRHSILLVSLGEATAASLRMAEQRRWTVVLKERSGCVAKVLRYCWDRAPSCLKKALMGWYDGPENNRTASTSSSVRNAWDSGRSVQPASRRSRMTSLISLRKSCGVFPSLSWSRSPGVQPCFGCASPLTYLHSSRSEYRTPFQSSHQLLSPSRSNSCASVSTGFDIMASSPRM